MKFKIFSFFFFAFLFYSLAGCGGSTNPSGNAPDISSQIQGVANDAIISGGTVTVYQFQSGQKGTVLGTAKTDSQGLFSLSISGYWGPVWVEIRGGSYVDDASGNVIFLAPDQYLSAVKNINAGENVGNLAITPLTTIAAALSTSYLNKGTIASMSIEAANSAISAIYGFDILQTAPANLTSAKVSFSPQAAYGLLLAGFSQMALQISSSNGLGAGSLSSIQLADMMAMDALDGVLDGKQFGQQISSGSYLFDSYNYRTKLCQNAVVFLSNARNQSGLGWNDVINSLNPIASYMNPLFPATDLPKPIENSPPTVTLSFNNIAPWTYLITAQASDTLSGITSFILSSSSGLISVKNGTQGYTSSISFTVYFSQLPDGPYTFTATAINGANFSFQTTTAVYYNFYNFCLTNPCRITG